MSLSAVSKNSCRATVRPDPSIAIDVPVFVIRTTEKPFSSARMSPTSVW